MKKSVDMHVHAPLHDLIHVSLHALLHAVPLSGSRRPSKPDRSTSSRRRLYLPDSRRTSEVALVGEEHRPNVRIALRQLDDLVVTRLDVELQLGERIVEAKGDELL